MMVIQPQNFSLPLVRNEQVNRDVMSFYFDRTKNPSYDFLPGQYNRVIIPSVQNDPRGTSRMFSIASSPLEKEYLMITTKISQSPFKQTLNSLQTGGSVDFFGPIGRFVYDETDTRHHVFLAGGIGLTPFRSMIMYAASKNLATPITMVVSFSTVEEFIYFDELTKISADHKNIKIIYTVTRPESSWTGQTGRISTDMIIKYIPDFQNCPFYICGSAKVTVALEEIVKSMNISEENIKKEEFPGY